MGKIIEAVAELDVNSVIAAAVSVQTRLKIVNGMYFRCTLRYSPITFVKPEA